MLDGAWGVLLQNSGLTEADFRGERFASHSRDLLNNPDVLNLTRPDVVRAVHDSYFAAGCDITTTNTFTATSIGQADYGLEGAVYDLNVAGARIAREAADAHGEVCRRLARPAQHHPLTQPAGRRPRLPHAHLRAGGRGLRRADPRARGRRRRPAADRDDLRHAQRQGRDRRGARGRAGAAALDQRHDRRSLGAHAQRSDDRVVLDGDRARRSADRRRQLLARRPRDAPVRRRPRAGRIVPDVVPSERRPSERVRRLRRDAGRDVDAPARVRAGGIPERRRLAAAARRPSTRARSSRLCAGCAAASRSRLAEHALQRARDVRARARHRASC